MNDDTNNAKQVDEEEQDTIVEVVEELAEQTNPELEAFEQELKDLEGKYKRALADYQNLEKRIREERIQWIKTASKDLLSRMLPIVDTLLLAQKHSQDKTLQVTTQQFLDLLKSEGVIRIETKNKKFDPKLMECITVEEGEEGNVLEELRAGFMLHETVLRPAGVKVGKQ
jgi:molecular chaperone GrpE